MGKLNQFIASQDETFAEAAFNSPMGKLNEIEEKDVKEEYQTFNSPMGKLNIT